MSKKCPIVSDCARKFRNCLIVSGSSGIFKKCAILCHYVPFFAIPRHWSRGWEELAGRGLLRFFGIKDLGGLVSGWGGARSGQGCRLIWYMCSMELCKGVSVTGRGFDCPCPSERGGTL